MENFTCRTSILQDWQGKYLTPLHFKTEEKRKMKFYYSSTTSNFLYIQNLASYNQIVSS